MDDPLLNQEIKLKDYFQVLSRRRWVMIAFFVICTATVTIGTFMMTPVYRAGTKIVIEGESTSVRTAENSSMDTGIEIYENYLETQMSLIKSDSIAGKIFEEFQLGKTPRYKKKEGWQKIFQNKFSKDLNLERIKGTRMIIISVDNPEPKMAADLANRFADLYIKDNMKRRALTFIRNQRMASLNAEFLRLQEKFDNLSTQYGPKHPEMVILKEEIRTMAKRIENERFGGTSEEGSREEKPVSENKQMLEESLLKIQESSVFSSSKMNNTGIVDVAYPPTEIFKPKIPLNIALGIVMGLIGGVLLAFFVDYLDDTIKTEDDLKRHVHKIPILGSIISERSMRNGLTKKADIDKLIFIHSESPSAEAYRLIRTRILWSASKDSAFKDFAVVSAGSSEGKSTIASNLAISFSQINKKTLLVDSDLRRGRLLDSYNLLEGKGLGEFLSGEAVLDEIIQKTEVPNLSAVTCGKSVIDTSQLFSSPKMSEFIRETRKRFDVIIYDTPPVIVISDTAVLVPQLGGSVFTARSGMTNARRLLKSFAIIKETSNAQLIGVILNATDLVDKKVYKNYYHKI